MKVQSIINFPISLGSYPEFLKEIISLAQKRKSCYICVAAVHQLIEAFRNPSFSRVAYGAAIVTPDGMPITWGLKFLYKIRQDRIAGMDMLPDLIRKASDEKLSIFFYGSTNLVLDKTKEHIHTHYPDARIAGVYSPPFRRLTGAEEIEIINTINSSGASIVFVALGCPKQERWMAAMKNRIQSTMVGIGAALSVMVGMQKRAPLWMQRSGLEWLFRLMQEPNRLWKRYFVTNSLFLFLLFREKLRILVPFREAENKQVQRKTNVIEK